MFICLLIISLLCCSADSWAQQKPAKKDSIRVVIAFDAANDKIETSYGFWEARDDIKVTIDMFGLNGGVKYLAEQYPMVYDEGEDAWVTTLPWGFFEMRMESLGFKNIKYPMRLKADFREEFKLDVDSTSYTYKKGKRYSYIPGTLNFTSTIIVGFKSGEPGDHFAFLSEALAVEGMEDISVIRIQKMRNVTSYLVNVDVVEQTPLNVILYRKMTKQSPIERGYIIGGGITRAIEAFQANPTVEYANPGFLDDPNQKFWKSANYDKSDQLERKLLRLMEEDPRVVDKINYIIEKTTPEEDKRSSQ